MTEKKNRMEWIDIIKGIGIFLVLLGHRETTPDIYYYIYSFHMALFFIVSGYLFSEQKYRSVIEFVCNRFKRLLIPFFIFNSLSLLVVYAQIKYPTITNNRSLPFYNSSIDLSNILIKQFFALDGNAIWNVALWFLPCLFVTEVLFFLIVRLVKYLSKKYPSFYFNSTLASVLIICSFIGYQINAHWIFSSNLMFTTVVFMGIGFLIKQYKLNFEKNSNSLLLLISLLTISIFVGYYINTNYSLNLTIAINVNVWRYIGGFISSISTFLVLMILSMLLNKQKLLSFLGRNSLFILSTHLFIFWFLQTLENIFMLHLYNYQPSILISLTYCIITLVISYPFIMVCNKCFPFVVGKIKRKYH